MKKNYFLLLLAFLSLNLIYAEPCPQGASSISSGNKIVFDYAPATSFCINRPTTIVVNGTSTYTLDLGSCSEIVSVYNLTSGPAITGQDFTVTSGFDTACIYSDGTLPVEEYTFLSKNLKVYPNPSYGQVYITGINEANIDIFNIAGQKEVSLISENQSAGTYNKRFETNNLKSGVYFIRLTSKEQSVVKKLIVE